MELSVAIPVLQRGVVMCDPRTEPSLAGSGQTFERFDISQVMMVVSGLLALPADDFGFNSLVRLFGLLNQVPYHIRSEW